MSASRGDETGERWFELARKTVEKTIANLPEDLRQHASRLPITYERRPHPDLAAEGFDEDILGLFVGQAYPDSMESREPMPAQIILYIENLREFAEDDEEVFQEEVETTFLHELGHYLGLDEDDLADRDLD
jgi:predicted Zn-dependent protease with MMP-like domain